MGFYYQFRFREMRILGREGWIEAWVTGGRTSTPESLWFRLQSRIGRPRLFSKGGDVVGKKPFANRGVQSSNKSNQTTSHTMPHLHTSTKNIFFICTKFSNSDIRHKIQDDRLTYICYGVFDCAACICMYWFQ